MILYKSDNASSNQMIKELFGSMDNFLYSSMITQNLDNDILKLKPENTMKLIDKYSNVEYIYNLQTLFKPNEYLQNKVNTIKKELSLDNYSILQNDCGDLDFFIDKNQGDDVMPAPDERTAATPWRAVAGRPRSPIREVSPRRPNLAGRANEITRRASRRSLDQRHARVRASALIAVDTGKLSPRAARPVVGIFSLTEKPPRITTVALRPTAQNRRAGRAV